jgi:hypothetical protein
LWVDGIVPNPQSNSFFELLIVANFDNFIFWELTPAVKIVADSQGVIKYHPLKVK